MTDYLTVQHNLVFDTEFPNHTIPYGLQDFENISFIFHAIILSFSSDTVPYWNKVFGARNWEIKKGAQVRLG